jgi:hypothetical protein
MRKPSLRTLAYVVALIVVAALFPWTARSPEQFRTSAQTAFLIGIVLFFVIRYGLNFLLRRLKPASHSFEPAEDDVLPTSNVRSFRVTQIAFAAAILTDLTGMMFSADKTLKPPMVFWIATLGQCCVFAWTAAYLCIVPIRKGGSLGRILCILLLALGATFFASSNPDILKWAPKNNGMKELLTLLPIPVWLIALTGVARIWWLRKTR